MKKIYLLLACTLAYGYADAQVKTERKMISSKNANISKISSGKNTNSVIYQEKAVTIWEDDFSDPNGRVDTLDNSTIVQGSGYTSATGLNTSGGTGTGLIVDIDVSELTYGLIINNAGTGYITGSGFTLTQIGGTGTGTGLTLDIVATDTFSLNDATLVPGTGYTSQNGVTTTSSGAGTGLLVDIEAAPIGGIDSLDMATLIGGSGYNDATGVATTAGTGAGLEVDIFTISGVIDSLAISAMGSNYNVGDVISITGGNGDASIIVESVTNGEITSVSVADAGDGNYTNGETISISGGNNDATINVLEVNGGEITEVTITSTGDQNYQNGDIFTVDGGDNNAEIQINAVIAGGDILDVMINESGANYTVGDVITIMAGDNSATIEVQSVYSTWTFENTSSPDLDWALTTAWPGNLGDFDEPNFATAANNYAIINSDAAGEGATQNAELITTKSIDLSTFPNATIRFSQYMRRWNTDSDQYYIAVSIDGGTTWVESEINTNLGGNVTSDNPEVYSFNISDIAGGEDNVKFKFRYVGNYGWFWTLDDITVVEPEDYDLATTLPNLYAGDMSAFDPELADGVDYYMIPESQITGMNFSANIANDGALDQTAAKLNVEGYDETNQNVFDQASTPFALNSGEDSTKFLNNTFTPPGAGTYSFKLYGSPDSDDLNPLNDTTELNNVMVGGNVYSRDNGVLSGGFTNVGGGAGNPFEIGNLFEFFGDFSMSTVQFYVSNGTDAANDVGKLIYSTIFKFEDGGLVPIFVSQDYEIKDADRGTFVSLPLVDEEGNDLTINAAAGEIYLVMVGHYGSDVVFSMAQSVNDLSVLFRTPGGDEGLGYFADMNAVVLRVSSENFASINEAEKDLSFKVYPNPAGNMTNVEFELENTSSVSFKLADMSGKTVYEVTEENTLSGKNTFTVPTKGLSNGVYFYSFKAGNKIINDKLIINK